MQCRCCGCDRADPGHTLLLHVTLIVSHNQAPEAKGKAKRKECKEEAETGQEGQEAPKGWAQEAEKAQQAVDPKGRCSAVLCVNLLLNALILCVGQR